MSNFQTTLKALREGQACISGYNKLVRFLQSKEFTKEDEKKSSYINFPHNSPISILTILTSNGRDDALWAISCIKGEERNLRLYAVWCARQVQHLMKDVRSLNALDVAEKYANGEASKEELDAARAAAWAAAVDAARAAAWDAAGAAAGAAAWAAAGAAAWDAAWAAAGDAARAAAWAAAGDAARAAAWAAAVDAQKEMLIKMIEGQAPWQSGEKHA